MKIDLSSFFTTPDYTRNGIPCFLCESRKKLIQNTPEEKVRQAVLRYLICELRVPAERALVEVPMSHYVKGASGRADIIVTDKDGKPVLIVECKEENCDVTDEAIAQARRYDTILKSGSIMVTNGRHAYFEVQDGLGYKQLRKIPSYRNLTKWRWFSFMKQETEPFRCLPIKAPIPESTVDLYIKEGCLGEDTSLSLHPFIFNLRGWLNDTQDQVAPAAITAVNILKDAGLRRSQFGNAGGGKFSGEYRYFVLEDALGNNQIVSISIFGGSKTINHPHWGNRKGYTYLTVAIDDFESSHMSLELNLDKFVDLRGRNAIIWHNGALTNGKLGQTPRQKVLEFIQKEAPHLVLDGKIILGEIDTGEEIKSENKATTDFLSRLILYALLRDTYRKIARKKQAYCTL
ncbi:type I restriction enzyme HsdR N-terminal domain-containing protein [Pontibacter toksunensis]|uniref:Type I restriction enzyme HsdR N-terminal domain-containing protein n=1 Tax=Pontibacter toksunensis TaxID=1332631 RepID=A0ABW6C2J4_9BACT